MCLLGHPLRRRFIFLAFFVFCIGSLKAYFFLKWVTNLETRAILFWKKELNLRMGPNSITGFVLWLILWCTPQGKKKRTQKSFRFTSLNVKNNNIWVCRLALKREKVSDPYNLIKCVHKCLYEYTFYVCSNAVNLFTYKTGNLSPPLGIYWQ